jgi:putative transcriptional regulator
MQKNIENPSMESLKGHFLIAMPSMADFNFSHTVTCLSEHTDKGALGMIINRMIPSLSARSIFEELKLEYSPKAESVPVYIGGPVHENEVFILHGPPFSWEGCLMITTTLAMSNTMDIIQAIAADRGPESFIITLGCAGWGPGQLEYELSRNAWLTCPADNRIIFDSPVDIRWNAAVKKMGIDPALLTETPGHA